MIYFYEPYVSKKELKMLVDPLTPKEDQPIPLSSLHREMIQQIIESQEDSPKQEKNKSKCWPFIANIITDSQDSAHFRNLLKTVKKFKRKQLNPQKSFQRRMAQTQKHHQKVLSRLSQQRFNSGSNKLTPQSQNKSISPNKVKNQVTLIKSMTLKSPIMSIKNGKEEEKISINASFEKRNTRQLNIKIDPLEGFSIEVMQNQANNNIQVAQLEDSVKESEYKASSDSSLTSESSIEGESKEGFSDQNNEDGSKKQSFSLIESLNFLKQASKKRQSYYTKNTSFITEDEDKKRMKSILYHSPNRRASVLVGSTAKKKFFSALGMQSMNLDLNVSSSNRKETLLGSTLISKNTILLQQKLQSSIQKKIDNEKFNEEITVIEPQNRLKSHKMFKYDMLNNNLSPGGLLLNNIKRNSVVEVTGTRNSLGNLMQNQQRPNSQYRSREQLDLTQKEVQNEISRKTFQFLHSVESTRHQVLKSLPSSKDIVSQKNLQSKVNKRRPWTGKIRPMNVQRNQLFINVNPNQSYLDADSTQINTPYTQQNNSQKYLNGSLLNHVQELKKKRRKRIKMTQSREGLFSQQALVKNDLLKLQEQKINRRLIDELASKLQYWSPK
ncbi:UNKNOWN [Stylonychia lemnae]|uniref:Uncharacterized protein n=1 Tax=Stylonychia lemnae TaxID=5949 RepID=A0A078AHD4_STYLE|nr:UNKNOWN [Stylonychia lemnae]|eukprot:CDW81700.1 UNKNOWN [Stylonychia lemnae]